jgi:hypothetical protein
MFLISAAAFATLLSYGVETKTKAVSGGKALKSATSGKTSTGKSATGTTTTSGKENAQGGVSAAKETGPATTTSESKPSETPTLTTTAALPQPIVGMLELRPSWTGSNASGEFHTENTAELGYKFNKDRYLGYVQYFNTNIYDPTTPANKGLGLVAKDGFFSFKMNNIWESGDKSWSLSWNPRLYMPTDASLRDKGLVAYARNYLNLTKKVSKAVSFTLSEIPIFFAFNRPGDSGAANQFFENRNYLIFDWNITDKLTFEAQIMFHETRYRNFAPGAKNNDTWTYTLWTWPELDYAITPNATIGVAWESDNFVNPDLSAGFQANGANLAVTQLVFRASL